MRQQLEQYVRLLTKENCAEHGQIAVCCQNDSINVIGPQKPAIIARQVLQRLDCSTVVVASPLLPFSAFLLRRAPAEVTCLVPRDSESRVSLHDIPFIRQQPNQDQLLDAICGALKKRKGCIVEEIGLISHGTLTIEQAYIAWSSLLHATTIKYFEDLLSTGPLLPEEPDFLKLYQTRYLRPLSVPDMTFRNKPAMLSHDIHSEMNLAGKITVQLGLVDSFFGNISYTTSDTCYISQTSARLDELDGQIDAVPFDGSSTAAITASSELPAHQAVIKATGNKIVLHGHPRFPVIMSFFATPSKHQGIDLVREIPVVDGEGGTGGLAETLPRAFILTGAKSVIVRGHGVFSTSASGFREALAALIDVENQCREIYFSLIYNRHPILAV